MKMNLSWYKGDDIIHQQLVRPNAEETKAVSDYESTAGENKSEQKTRQAGLKNAAFTYGWTIPESLAFDYPNAKISPSTSGPLATAAALQLSCRYAAVRTEQIQGPLLGMRREVLVGTDLFWGHKCNHCAIRTANPSDSGGDRTVLMKLC